MAPPLKGVVAGGAFRRSLVELVLLSCSSPLRSTSASRRRMTSCQPKVLVLAGLLLVRLALRPPGVAATSECVGPGLASGGAV